MAAIYNFIYPLTIAIKMSVYIWKNCQWPRIFKLGHPVCIIMVCNKAQWEILIEVSAHIPKKLLVYELIPN